MDLAARLIERAGGAVVREIVEGHQSRVFELMLGDGQRLVAKVIDASATDMDVVVERAAAVAELASHDRRVCRPVAIDGALVNTIEDDAGRSALFVCWEFADGDVPDLGSLRAADMMGVTLAGLHRSLRRVATRAIPRVAAMRAVSFDAGEEEQLLHGDFNAQNLRVSDGAVRVFDFDDCGYGPRSFDIANALYMVLFSWSVDGHIARYRPFAEAFLRGYETEEGERIDRRTVDDLIDLRVRALDAWLGDLSSAPVGIRNASPQWHATLRSFVAGYEGSRL